MTGTWKSARLTLVVLVVGVASLVTLPSHAGATLPGKNGGLLLSTQTDAQNGWTFDRTLVLVSPDGSDGRGLSTPDGAQVDNAVLSPDGGSVIYGNSASNRYPPEKSVFSMGVFDSTPVSVWNLDGFSSYPPPLEALSYSPDGKSILRTNFYYGWASGTSYDIYRDPLNGVYIHSLTTNETYRLKIPSDIDPTSAIYSPDGRRIAFTTGNDFTGPSAIYLMNLSTYKVTELRETDYPPENLSFSPNGRTLAFDEFREYGATIYSLDINGSDLQTLSHDESSSHPVFSPDGRRIAFARLNHDEPVWTMKVDGSDKRPLPRYGHGDTPLDWARATPFKIANFNSARSKLVVRTWGPGTAVIHGPLVSRASKTKQTGGYFALPVTPRKGVRLKAGAEVKLRVRFEPKGALPTAVTKYVKFFPTGALASTKKVVFPSPG